MVAAILAGLSTLGIDFILLFWGLLGGYASVTKARADQEFSFRALIGPMFVSGVSAMALTSFLPYVFSSMFPSLLPPSAVANGALKVPFAYLIGYYAHRLLPAAGDRAQDLLTRHAEPAPAPIPPETNDDRSKTA
jgi:hypothetical protein